MEMRLLMVYGLFAHLLIACKEAPTPHDGLLFPPGKSHLAKVRVLNYTDSFQTLSVEANFAEVQDKSTESMFFTGNTQMISYPSDGIEPNMLWADSLRANFRSETLLSAGNCVLVTSEGDTFETSNLYFGQDSLSSRHNTRAVFNSRAERNVVLDPGEHILDSFVYTSSTIQLWKN